MTGTVTKLTTIFLSLTLLMGIVSFAGSPPTTNYDYTQHEHRPTEVLPQTEPTTGSAFMPLSTVSVTSWSELRAAVSDANTSVILVENDFVTDFAAGVGAAITIPAGRNITIESATDNETFVILKTLTARHFIVFGTLTLENIILSGNYPPNQNDIGGITVATGGHLIMKEGSEITNCRTRFNGAGVRVEQDATFTMYGGRIANNRSTAFNSPAHTLGGGGVFIGPGSTFIMHGGTIERNIAHTWGGGVHVEGGTFIMYENASVINNRAIGAAANPAGPNRLGNGGGVSVNNNGTLHMHGGSISDNAANHGNAPMSGRGNGGGVAIADSSTFNMYGGKINDNTAQSEGGGVSLMSVGATFNFIAGEIKNNGHLRRAYNANNSPITISTTRNGGGVSVVAGAVFNMGRENCDGSDIPIIYNSRARDVGGGGGVWVSGTFNMYSGIISENSVSSPRGGGGVSVPAFGDFTMHNGTISGNTALEGGGVRLRGASTFTMKDGVISGNTASVGGGVSADGNAVFYMIGGVIRGNTATSSGGIGGGGGGGVHASGGGRFIMTGGIIGGDSPEDANLANQGAGVLVSGTTATNPRGVYFTMDNDAAIRGNIATVSGGGVQVHLMGAFEMNGGEISGNTATWGGGVMADARFDSHMMAYFRNLASFVMNDGVISDNTATLGGGVHVFDGTFTQNSGLILNNNATADGGGIHVRIRTGINLRAGSGSVRLNNGKVINNSASRGGGVHVAGGSFNFTSGEISGNIANNGGGLFVPHNNNSLIPNVTIWANGIFTNNTARNGMFINTPMEILNPQITPGTVTWDGLGFVVLKSDNMGNYSVTTPHAFTNYDINVSGPRFWQVTNEVRGGGTVTAKVGNNGFVVNGYFVPEGTEVSFTATPNEGYEFVGWEIRTRNSLADEFEFYHSYDNLNYGHEVVLHTHAIAKFIRTVTVTFNANHGDTPATSVQNITFGGTYQPAMDEADVIALQARDGYTFAGWWTTPTDGGVQVLASDKVTNAENHTLFARWEAVEKPEEYITISYEVDEPAPSISSPLPVSTTQSALAAVLLPPALTTTETTNAAGQTGTWVFIGWHRDGILVTESFYSDENVTLVGRWRFDADEEAEHPEVIYRVGDPAPVTSSPLPARQFVTPGHMVVVLANLTTTETTNAAGQTGTWTFNGWLLNGVLVQPGYAFEMPDYDVELVGSWTFTPVITWEQPPIIWPQLPQPEEAPPPPTTQPPYIPWTPRQRGEPEPVYVDYVAVVAEDDPPELIAVDPLPITPIHHAYMIGYAEDGTIRPLANITRAEVTTIFFRLITDEHRANIWTQTNSFADVQLERWFNNAVSTMENGGLFVGIPLGKNFAPNQAATRAEFAAMVVNYLGLGHIRVTNGDAFTDIDGHWASDAINVAYLQDWVRGFGDGTFRPDALITRAEVAALVNRAFNRLPETPADLLPGMVIWPDNMNQYAWYYLYIQEASNSHRHEMKDDGVHERWTELIEPRNWRSLERPYSQPHHIFD